MDPAKEKQMREFLDDVGNTVVRLEYNPKRGLFHFNNNPKRKKCGFGFHTICNGIKNKAATAFIESVRPYFPLKETEPPPTLHHIKDAYDDFFDTYKESVTTRQCLCCGQGIKAIEPKNNKLVSTEPEHDMWENGIVGRITGGYGSTKDGNVYIVSICDRCLDKKEYADRLELISTMF